MIIQCPKCDAKYRTRVLVDAHSPLQASCPKCNYRFLVVSDSSDALVSSVSPRILIIDDARFFRELILDLLTGRDAELDTANSAREGWEKLLQNEYDLVMVDINLPDMSGLDLIGKIRQEGSLKAVKVLCISGVYRKDTDALNAIRAGADDFISKSFQPDEFNSRIDKLLRK